MAARRPSAHRGEAEVAVVGFDRNEPLQKSDTGRDQVAVVESDTRRQQGFGESCVVVREASFRPGDSVAGGGGDNPRRSFEESDCAGIGRIGGLYAGIIANNPLHLGGAIDADGADKAARFMQLCDGHGIPILFLCDTPGFMVGPDAEKNAQVRRFGRMFVVGASLTVPFATVVFQAVQVDLAMASQRQIN